MIQNFLKKNNQQGMSLLLPVLILGAVGISVFLMISTSTLGALNKVAPQRSAVEIKSYLLGCLDEYIIHLPTNPDYSPGTLTFFDEICSLVVTAPESGQRQVVIVAQDESVTRQITAVIQLDPLTILDITEP